MKESPRYKTSSPVWREEASGWSYGPSFSGKSNALVKASETVSLQYSSDTALYLTKYLSGSSHANAVVPVTLETSLLTTPQLPSVTSLPQVRAEKHSAVTVSGVKESDAFLEEIRRKLPLSADNDALLTSSTNSSDVIYKRNSASNEIINLRSDKTIIQSSNLRRNTRVFSLRNGEQPFSSVYSKTPFKIQSSDFSYETLLTLDSSASNQFLSSTEPLRVSKFQPTLSGISKIYSSFSYMNDPELNAGFKQTSDTVLKGSYSSEFKDEIYSSSGIDERISPNNDAWFLENDSITTSFQRENESYLRTSSSLISFTITPTTTLSFGQDVQRNNNEITPEPIVSYSEIRFEQTFVHALISSEFDHESHSRVQDYRSDSIIYSDLIQNSPVLLSELQIKESGYTKDVLASPKIELTDEEVLSSSPHHLTSEWIPPLNEEPDIVTLSSVDFRELKSQGNSIVVPTTVAILFQDIESTKLADVLVENSYSLFTFQNQSASVGVSITNKTDSSGDPKSISQYGEWASSSLTYSDINKTKRLDLSSDFTNSVPADNTLAKISDPFVNSNYATKYQHPSEITAYKDILPSDSTLQKTALKASQSKIEQSTLSTHRFFTHREEESMQLMPSSNSGISMRSTDIASRGESTTAFMEQVTATIKQMATYTPTIRASKVVGFYATSTPTQTSFETFETAWQGTSVASDQLQATELLLVTSSDQIRSRITPTPSVGLSVTPSVPSSQHVFAPPPPKAELGTSALDGSQMVHVSPSIASTRTRESRRTSHLVTSSIVNTNTIVDKSPMNATPRVSNRTTPTLSPVPGSRTNSTQGSISDHSSEIIIGSAAAVFLLALIVIGTLLCLRWKRLKTKKPSATTDDLWMDGSNHHTMMPLPSLTTCSPATETPARRENIYTVAFPYQPLQDGQLSLKKGDKLELMETADNGWWRGVSVKKGTSGWFPSSYVTTADNVSSEDIDNGSNEDIFSQNTEGGQENENIHGQISSFQIKRITSTETEKESKTPPVVQEQENMKDVQGWVNMAASISMMSLPTTELSYSTNITDFTTAANGQRFRAVYAYKPVNRGEMGLKEGELVTCQERDRNGWMLGRKTRTGEQGWFPAVYVDQVSSDDESVSDPEIPETYDLLESNKLHKVNQTFIGIDHEVAYPFSSPVPGDLALTPGETVTVLQTLANGWWFGVRDQKCGWFPATFVDMMEDTTPTEAQSQQGQLTSKEVAALLLAGLSKSDSPEEQITPKAPETKRTKNVTGSLSLPGSVAMRKHKSDDRLDVSSISSQNMVNELRPHRKAPPPPSSLRNSVAISETASDIGSQQDGTLRRPARRAPAPPVSHNATSTEKNPEDKVGASQSQVKPNDTAAILVNGKRPKLQKITSDRVDKKSLNPMIRPATRGFMSRPVDNSRDIWESRPEKRLLEGNHHKSSQGNRALSNLGSHVSSPVDQGPDSGSPNLASGHPSPTSHSSLMSERLIQNLTGHNTRPSAGLSRSSSLGSSINSHATLSTPAAAVINSSSLSDDSRATVTNLPEPGNTINNQDTNDDGDDESNNDRNTPVSRSITELGVSRSRSQSPAVFPPASPSALFQNIHRFNQRNSHYSSDASDGGSSPVRPVSIKSLNIHRKSGEPPPPPSSTTHRDQRPKSKGVYSKRRDRRHRTLTSVPPPSVPRPTSTTRSLSGEAKDNLQNENNFPKIKINIHKASHNLCNNLEAEGDDALRNSQSTFHSPPIERLSGEPSNSKHNASPLKTESHSDGQSSTVSNNSVPTAVQQDSAINAVYHPDSGVVELCDSSTDTTNSSNRLLRHQAPNPRLGIEDTPPARDSLKNLVPGTVSGIVEQINKLSPHGGSPSTRSSDRSNDGSSCNSSQGKGSIGSFGGKGISSALNGNNTSDIVNVDPNCDNIKDNVIVNETKENIEVENITSIEYGSALPKSQLNAPEISEIEAIQSNGEHPQKSSITLDTKSDCSKYDPETSDV